MEPKEKADIIDKTDKADVGKLERVTAVKIARSFWLAFNNVNMYGPEHRVSLDSVEQFHEFLMSVMETVEPITFYIDNSGLVCEGWKIGKEVRIQRLIDRLENAGIDSLSFPKTMTRDDMVELFKVLLDTRNFEGVDPIAEHLREKGIESIRFNQFSFQKVAADEEGEGGAGGDGGDGGADTVSPLLTLAQNILQGLQAGDEFTGEMKGFFKDEAVQNDTSGVLLPRVKDHLFDNGITHMQYIQLVHQLSREMNTGEFDTLMQQSSGDSGVDVEDIALEIEQNPAHIISLSRMGIQLALQLGSDWNPLIKLLAQYMDTALHNRVLTHFVGKEVEDVEEIRRTIDKIKHQLYRQMLENEFPPEVLHDVDGLLKERLPVQVNMIRARMMIDATLRRDRMPDEPGLAALAVKMKAHPEEKTLLPSILFQLEEMGYTKGLLDHFMQLMTGIAPAADAPKEKEEAGTDAPKEQPVLHPLPDGVLELAETKRLLQMEINRNIRYKSPLSCLSVSVVRELSLEKTGKPQPAEIAAAFVKVTELLRRSLRNLDFIGSLGVLEDNHLVVLLSMTGWGGARVVLERLREEVKHLRIELDGEFVTPAYATSAISFNFQETPDLNSFLRRLKARQNRASSV